MNVFLSATKNELHKLLLKKKYFVLTIIGAFVCFLRLGGDILVAKLSEGQITLKSNLVVSMLGFTVDILVPLIVFMAVTDLFTGEMQEDSFKASLLRPVSRFKVLLSKTVAAFVLGCIVTFLMFLVSAIMQMISGRGFSNIPHSLAIYLVDMIPILSIAVLAVFINIISKSPTLSMLLCIAVYVLFKYINYYVSPIGQMIFTAYSQWHKIWLGTSLPFGALMAKTGILFGSILILYTLSYIMFDRKDC